MEKQFKKYFLGANSCEGFVSHFADCYSPEDGWRAYIIKGGPGTGKSSFMKYMVSRAQKCGFSPELCICSSDPQSLDGIIINELKVVFLDGTAPHIVEPRLPGVSESIINLGAYWDEKKLSSNREGITELMHINSLLHKRASNYLKVCGELMLDNLKSARACTDEKKVMQFSKTLCKKLIPVKIGESGKESVRFISGTTPLGIVTYSKTLTDHCDNILILDDKYGSVAGIITDRIRSYVLKSGYDIITVKNPFLPSALTDHIIIPKLSLCIATENEFVHTASQSRRIHSRRFTDAAKLKEHKPKMSFNRKVIKELMLTACETLAEAKGIHDLIEKYYIDAMDFEGVALLAEKTAEKIGL